MTLQLRHSWAGCWILGQCLQRHDCQGHAWRGGVQLRITCGRAAGPLGDACRPTTAQAACAEALDACDCSFVAVGQVAGCFVGGGCSGSCVTLTRDQIRGMLRFAFASRVVECTDHGRMCFAAMWLQFLGPLPAPAAVVAFTTWKDISRGAGTWTVVTRRLQMCSQPTLRQQLCCLLLTLHDMTGQASTTRSPSRVGTPVSGSPCTPWTGGREGRAPY